MKKEHGKQIETLRKERKAYRVFNGKKYTLYSSGEKKRVDDYLKQYGVPKNALYRKIKVAGEYRLYMHFKK